MSTLPALIDELRKCEREWYGSNMFELARMCREAADTITELRGALQVASVDYRHLQDENARLRSCLSDDAENARMIMDENAKLREELESVGTAAYLYGRSDLKAENAKLRELVDYMTPIALYAASERELYRMRELGVEVDA